MWLLKQKEVNHIEISSEKYMVMTTLKKLIQIASLQIPICELLPKILSHPYHFFHGLDLIGLKMAIVTNFQVTQFEISEACSNQMNDPVSDCL